MKMPRESEATQLFAPILFLASTGPASDIGQSSCLWLVSCFPGWVLSDRSVLRRLLSSLGFNRARFVYRAAFLRTNRPKFLLQIFEAFPDTKTQVITPDTDCFGSAYAVCDAESYFDYYFWNVTNAEQWFMGVAPPALEEIGPYAFLVGVLSPAIPAEELQH